MNFRLTISIKVIQFCSLELGKKKRKKKTTLSFCALYGINKDFLDAFWREFSHELTIYNVKINGQIQCKYMGFLIQMKYEVDASRVHTSY